MNNMNRQPYCMNPQQYSNLNQNPGPNINQQLYPNMNQQRFTNMNQQEQLYSTNQHTSSNAKQQNPSYSNVNNEPRANMNQRQTYSNANNQQTLPNMNQQHQVYSNVAQQMPPDINYQQAPGYSMQNASTNQTSTFVKVERKNDSVPNKFFEVKKPLPLMPVPSNAQRNTYGSSWQKQGPITSTSRPTSNFTSNETLSSTMDKSVFLNDTRIDLGNRTNIPQNGALPNPKDEKKTEGQQRTRTEQENIRFLTGNIEKVLKWHRLLNEFCHYEVFGPVIQIQEGTVRMQKVMLMRDKKGPVLKVIHYVNDRIDLPNFHLGQVIRCVGRMININTLQAIYIREATNSEIAALPRMYYICDQEVARTIQNKSSQHKQ